MGNIEDLENRLTNCMEKMEHGRPKNIIFFMTTLKKVDEDTFDHSVRVGEYGKRLAEYLDEDIEKMFDAFVLHDIGKAYLGQCILGNHSLSDNAECVEIMKKHPHFSYLTLKEFDRFYAEVALRHHRYQNGSSYPATLPNPPREFTGKDLALVEKYAILLSIVDSYDSMTTRKFNSEIKNNGSTTDSYPYTSEIAKQKLIQKFQPYESQFKKFFEMNAKEFIDDLYDKGIIGEKIGAVS
jgi:HD-GYP domain-containing protein (c-di-GMP phosphodiesterase class II)